MSAAAADSPVRILHLSDIHFRAGKAWDSDPVLRALVRYLAAEVEDGLKPDLVAITGDLAFAGKREEYDLAGTWLDRDLWPVLTTDPSVPLSKDRLLLVPGNHDADRVKVDFVADMVQNGLLAERDQVRIAAFLNDPGQRGVLTKRHAAYLDFYEDWLGVPQPLPWWQRTIDIRGRRLHVAGLNSAWMSCGDSDRGRLLLGRYQVNETVLHRDGEKADWRLALLHHPWDYLAEFDARETRRDIHLHRDLVLRGHLHQPQGERILPQDPDRACLELAAGCVYDGSGYPNAFQWIELHTDPKRVRVLFRAWVQGKWQVDGNQPGCPDGEFTFDLAAPRPKPNGTVPESPPADFRKYLEDLWDDTAHIDIRGLVTGRPEAHRFPIEELYIELQATGTLRENDGGGDPRSRAANPGTRPDSPLHRSLSDSRLVVVGDPGCGKTTFLRWVAHCLAGDRLGRDPSAAARRLGLNPGPDGVRLPIPVPIADWLAYIEAAEARKTGPALATGADWLPAYLGARAADANQGPSAHDFRRLLCAGEALILLDGLDEAPDRPRRKRSVALIERLARTWKDCPLVVTCRPAAYRDDIVLGGFAHARIEALDAAAVDGFLARWARALFPERPDKAEAHRRELAAALDSRREIRRMARNTVMLTALAVVHWNEKRLPEQRAELYESIVKWLIESREQRLGREKTQRCRQLLAELALAMQSDPEGRRVQVPRRWAAGRIARRFGTDADTVERAETFLAEEEIDSGILVRRDRQLRFWHLTFQEYLAAQALAGRRDADRTALLLGEDPALYRPEWRETVLLLGGVLYLQGADKADALIASVLDALGEDSVRAAQTRTAGLLGALVRDLDPFGYRPADPRYGQVLDAALAVFDPAQAPAIPLADRIAAAEALAQVGDPRLDWTDPQHWVELPGGRFSMGAQKSDQQAPGYDPEANDNESPVHPVALGDFRIAAFPVTVAEYGRFLDDEDCRKPAWWVAGGGDKAPEPDDWEEQQAHPSRPVVHISWHQAMAFCAWLTDRLGRPLGAKGTVWLPRGLAIRLPTEAEWEYAARGEAGRRYPWGDEAPDGQRANYREAKVGAPTPVGIFTGDRTPEGVLDLAGNVWEWCLDADVEGFYGQCQREGPVTDPCAIGDVGAPRVLRGGAFGISGARFLRLADRVGNLPEVRFEGIGFRCALAPPRQP